MSLVIKQVPWLDEAETPAAVDEICPHDGTKLSTEPCSPPMRYCSTCRRVWNDSGKRLPTVWWGGSLL